MKTKVKKRKNKFAQEETRFRVAEFLKHKRGTQKQAADIFGITERAVNKIWANYKQGGKRSLASKKRAVKSGIKLKKDQAYKIPQMIKDKLPRPSGRSIRYDPILRERPLDYKYSSTISPDSPEYCLALLHNQRGADALLYFGS